MPTTERLREVKAYFDHGDNHLGYRRLLDSAIETQDMEVFERTLAFADWYDQYTASHDTNAASHVANVASHVTNVARHDTNPTMLNEQVSAILEQIGRSAVTLPRQATQPVINLGKVSKSYSKGNFSLKEVDLELYPGRIIGLVGENGNGKTTLLRLLYGELRPDKGTITYQLNGASKGQPFYETKTRLGFIAQRPDPWYGSLMENLQFTATHYGFRGRENRLWTEMICARMGLRAFRTYNWSRISSGYKMRFELARAIIKKPEVLLLDEPLANLDVLAQQVILEDLRFLAQSEQMPIGIILSSQQLYEVEKVSEQVIFLKDGRPRYQSTRPGDPASTDEQLVLELETTASREQLQEVFAGSGLQNISYNGGVYLLYFNPSTKSNDIITRLGTAAIPVKYLRDISASSRRFFNA